MQITIYEDIAEVASEGIHYLLETQQPFSQSLLWDLQRRYFAERGAEAWRQGEVPHYVTSNPTMAGAYAEMVFACWRDQQLLGDSEQPFYICELGAGSGRFAFHFLSRLARLCRESGTAPDAFRYVLTDFTQSNLDAWRSHPRFQPFFAEGLLDMALFDVDRSEHIALQLSGGTLSPGGLRRPLAVIANYLFDSVPQDLFYFKDGAAYDCLVSLATAENPEGWDVAELLNRLSVHYDYQPSPDNRYPETELQALLEFYREALDDCHLLFPAAGLRCLQRLRALSQQGLMLLSADKGDHRLEQIAHPAPPGLVCHGSFSLGVNYHAFQAYCRNRGGMALVPEHRHQSVEVICLLLLENAEGFAATRQAYRKQVLAFSPDDFYTLAKQLQNLQGDMTLPALLACLRLSDYDAHQLARFLPRLAALAPDLSPDQIEELKSTLDKVWEGYFPMREEQDLAFAIASIFYDLDDFPTALAYFRRSEEIYGPHTGMLYNMAVCHQLLNQPQQAGDLLERLIRYDHANQPAQALLCQLRADGIATANGSPT